jgi:hypothetical protein
MWFGKSPFLVAFSRRGEGGPPKADRMWGKRFDLSPLRDPLLARRGVKRNKVLAAEQEREMLETYYSC